MNNQTTNISLRQAAIIAGISMILLAILAPFGYAYVILGHIDLNNIAKTINNIEEAQVLFSVGIISLLINAIFDIVVAWALFYLLKSVNKSISLLAAWFRVAYSAILVVALSNLLNVIHLIKGENSLTGLEPALLHIQTAMSIESFYNVWDFGLVIFSIHLLLLGYLVYKSGYLPRFLGVLLFIAGFGYAHDSISKILSTNYTITIGEFTFIGELLLVFWVLRLGIKGVNKN